MKVVKLRPVIERLHKEPNVRPNSISHPQSQVKRALETLYSDMRWGRKVSTTVTTMVAGLWLSAASTRSVVQLIDTVLVIKATTAIGSGRFKSCFLDARNKRGTDISLERSHRPLLSRAYWTAETPRLNIVHLYGPFVGRH